MKKTFLTVLVLVSAIFLQDVSAQKIPTMEFYHGATCPHCHNAKAWFPELLKAYPDLQIEEYEVWNDAENQKRFRDRMAQLGKEAGGVPTMVIGEEVIVGFNPETVLTAMEANYGPPSSTPVKTTKTEGKKETEGKSLWQKIIDFFTGLFS